MGIDAEKSSKNKKVSRFGKDCYDDTPVEYKPIVRKGGRKISTKKIDLLKVPVKSSISGPLDTIRMPKRNGEEKVVQETEIITNKQTDVDINFNDSMDDLMNVVDNIKYEEIQEPTKPQQINVQLTKEEILNNSLKNAIRYHEGPYEEDETDDPDDLDELDDSDDLDELDELDELDDSDEILNNTKLTPFERRQKSTEYGIPSKFFYAMNTGGYLEGDITPETCAVAIRLFISDRLQEKVINDEITVSEIGMVAKEIKNLMNGINNIISEDDVIPDSTPEDIFRIILDKIRIKNRK